MLGPGPGPGSPSSVLVAHLQVFWAVRAQPGELGGKVRVHLEQPVPDRLGSSVAQPAAAAAGRDRACGIRGRGPAVSAANGAEEVTHDQQSPRSRGTRQGNEAAAAHPRRIRTLGRTRGVDVHEVTPEHWAVPPPRRLYA